MKKIEIGSGLILVLAGGLLLVFVPDALSLLMVGVMCALLVFGYIMGLRSILKFDIAFRSARNTIARARKVQAEKTWLVIFQNDTFFNHDWMDNQFRQYRDKVQQQKAENEQVSMDLEELIDEDNIALQSWQNIVSQIPDTLTGLGLLGTFLGLLIGISGVGFTSVSVALGSVQTLLSGISTAFYTSIAGVILSILFNMLLRFAWGLVRRDLALFYQDYHAYIVSSVAQQEQQEQIRCREAVMAYIAKQSEE